MTRTSHALQTIGNITPALELTIGPEINESAKDRMRAARSPATKRAYASDLADFARWCADTPGQTPIPTDAATIVNYIDALASAGAANATIERRIASLSSAHQHLGHSNPARAEMVRLTLAGIKRQIGTAQRKKDALTIEDLRAVCHALPDDLRGKRDRAVLTMLFAGAFRRSELSALNRSDVKVTARDVVVTVRRSKTDQDGAGEIKRLPRLDDPSVCPHAALSAWLAASGVTAGRLFRGVFRGKAGGEAFSDRTIARIVKARAAAAGLAGDFGGHSGRSGFVTSAFDRGVTEADVMAVTGHRSVNILRGYRRRTGAEQAKAIKAVMG